MQIGLPWAALEKEAHLHPLVFFGGAITSLVRSTA
jgi:hypothetical protein